MQTHHMRNSRLRIVFADTFVSYSLAADATFGEIARQWAALSSRYRGETVAVDVTLRPDARTSHRRPICPTGLHSPA
jgi:hypothetical protein